MLNDAQSRLVAQPDQADFLQVDSTSSRLMYSSTQTATRLLSLGIADDYTSGREYDVANMTEFTTAQVVAEVITGGLRLQTQGITATLDLGIRGLEGNAQTWFVHRGITVTASSVLTVTAPSIGPSSVVTVLVSGSGITALQVLVLDNQVKRMFMPVIGN
jgi:hypothetical protein